MREERERILEVTLLRTLWGLLGAQGRVLEASDCSYSKGERKNLRFCFFFVCSCDFFSGALRIQVRHCEVS